MTDTITLTELMREHPDGNEAGWGVEFEWLRRNDADAIHRLLRLIKRDGITEPVLIGDDGRVWDGHHRIYVASLLGIRDIPVRYA